MQVLSIGSEHACFVWFARIVAYQWHWSWLHASGIPTETGIKSSYCRTHWKEKRLLCGETHRWNLRTIRTHNQNMTHKLIKSCLSKRIHINFIPSKFVWRCSVNQEWWKRAIAASSCFQRGFFGLQGVEDSGFAWPYCFFSTYIGQ